MAILGGEYQIGARPVDEVEQPSLVPSDRCCGGDAGIGRKRERGGLSPERVSRTRGRVEFQLRGRAEFQLGPATHGLKGAHAAVRVAGIPTEERALVGSRVETT